MSTADNTTLMETHGPNDRAIAELPSVLSYLESPSTTDAGLSASHTTATNDVKNPFPEIWMDEPQEQSSQWSADEGYKRGKQSRSKFRHGFSSSTSSVGSSRSKRRRRAKEYQTEREHTTGKRNRHSSKSYAYASSKEKPSSLYKRSREDHARRIKRQPNKAVYSQDRPQSFVSPSLLSVLSALTGGTESSSGSNTTVTQTSYEWPEYAESVSSFKQHRGHSKDSRRSVRTKDRPRIIRGPSQEAIDVFKFLETDPTIHDAKNFSWDPPSGSSSASETPHATYTHTPATSRVIRSVTFDVAPDKEDSSYPDLLHSDSGVSVGGESPEFKRRTNLHYGSPSAESAPDGAWPKEEPHADGTVTTDAHPDDSSGRAFPSSYQNGPYFPQPRLRVSPQPPSYSLYRAPGRDHIEAEPSDSPLTITGYELLSSKLSAVQSAKHGTQDYIVPLYRRFEPLHHRVLLHLQDEICELEEELRRLDECIARSQPYIDGLLRPASRREDVRFGDSLRYERTDLLGRICMKLNTYNQSLQSYTSVAGKAEHADEDDIHAYKDWLQRHQPIARAESAFLDHHLDLFRISSSSRPHDTAPEREIARETSKPDKPQAALFQSETSAKWALAGPPAALLLTFIAFLVIPTLFGRLVVLSILAGVGYTLLVTAQVDECMTGREMACCMGIYIGVMATIAGALQ